MSSPDSTWSLIRYHWSAGARVALRSNALVGATVVFLFGSAPEALSLLHVTVLEFVSRGANWRGRMEFAAICVALAGVAMPRVTLGATGWMRSLAVSSSTSRRAAIVALCWTQAFAIVVGVLATVLAVFWYHAPLAPAKLAGIPIAILAAATVVLPVRHRAGPLLAIVALMLTVPGRWAFDGIALLLLGVADRVAGPIVPLRRRGRRRSSTPSAAPIAAPRWQWARLTWRALPKASVLAGCFFPVVFVAFGYFVVLNNPDLAHETALRAVRIAGSLGALALTAALTSTILRSRPVWAWARSLPWAARDRVLNDALLLFGALLLVPISITPLVLGPALAVAATVPTLAAAGAAAIRAGVSRQTGTAGEVAIVGIASGTLIAIWSPLAIVVLLSAPFFLRLAVAREQRSGATRWDELHHDAAGDPVWMSVS